MCLSGTALPCLSDFTVCVWCVPVWSVVCPWALMHPFPWLQSVCLSVPLSTSWPCPGEESEQEPLTCPRAHSASAQPHPSLNLQSEGLPPQVCCLWPRAGRLRLREGVAGTGSELGLGISPRPWAPGSQLLSPPWLEASGQGEPTSKGVCGVRSVIDRPQTALPRRLLFCTETTRSSTHSSEEMNFCLTLCILYLPMESLLDVAEVLTAFMHGLPSLAFHIFLYLPYGFTMSHPKMCPGGRRGLSCRQPRPCGLQRNVHPSPHRQPGGSELGALPTISHHRN